MATPITLTPPQGDFQASGSIVSFKIASTSASKLAFKVKTSNNEFYRVRPVFGFVTPNGTADLEVQRLSGPPKLDKLVIQWAEVPEEEVDPKAPFAAQAQQGEILVVIEAK